MAEQIVTLNPGESKIVTFEVVAHEAKTYQVSVNGLTGSFNAVPPTVYTCPYCGATFATQAALETHIATIHGAGVYQCGNCGQYFSSRAELDAHMTIHPGTIFTETEFYLGEQKIIRVTVSEVPLGMLPPGSVTRPDGTLTTQWYDPTQIDWRTRTRSKGWYRWYGFTELWNDMRLADNAVYDTWVAYYGQEPEATELYKAVLGMYIKNTELWLEDAYRREPYITLASPTEADLQEAIRLEENKLANLKEALANLG